MCDFTFDQPTFVVASHRVSSALASGVPPQPQPISSILVEIVPGSRERQVMVGNTLAWCTVSMRSYSLDCSAHRQCEGCTHLQKVGILVEETLTER